VENAAGQEVAEGRGGVLLTHTLFMLCRAPHWLELGFLGRRRFYQLTVNRDSKSRVKLTPSP